MLEILYRIYEVANEETKKENAKRNMCYGSLQSTSKNENNELLMDCLICDTREQFKDIIRDTYGKEISFAYSKKLKENDLYCIIIGEHCYNAEKYFNKMEYICDFCGITVSGYYHHKIGFDNYDIKHDFYGIEDYLLKKFCCDSCKYKYKEKEKALLQPDDEKEFFVTKEMFSQDTNKYVYKITKKSTSEVYVGQSQYVPTWRWSQHLLTERFALKNIMDYQFEVIEVVPKNVNILEREKFWIQKYYKENPKLSLNIMQTAKVDIRENFLDNKGE